MTLCRKLKLSEDFDYQQLARLTPGYVGADLMALCREAAMNAVNRVLIMLGGSPRSSSLSSRGHLSAAGPEAETEADTESAGAEKQTTNADPEAHTQSAQDHPQVPAPLANVCFSGLS